MQWKWKRKWSQKWMKNGWKRPTVNDPNVTAKILARIVDYVPALAAMIASLSTPQDCHGSSTREGWNFHWHHKKPRRLLLLIYSLKSLFQALHTKADILLSIRPALWMQLNHWQITSISTSGKQQLACCQFYVILSTCTILYDAL